MAGKMAKQLAGSGTGQSLMDRVTQAKYSLAGSALGKIVAKASTEELIAPKKKHLEHLVRLSNEPNVSIPLLVNFLGERMHEKSWVVVFKALITTHHLLNYGNEKISQYMASNNCRFYLPHFNDKSSSQSYEMSLFIRKYSKYLAEKTKSYQMMAFDFCKVKRGKDDGVMRTMPADKLLKALPVLRDQLYVLFEFEATEKDLNNLIINAAFILLYKDLIRLFASYNEGMMNLVEKYFTMKRSQCQTAIELYRDFPNVMSKVDEFLTVAELLGIGDKESMGLHPVPPQILGAMEKHLAILKKKKKGGDDENDETEEEEQPAETATKKAPQLPSAGPKVKSASPARPKSPARPTASPARTKPAEAFSPHKKPSSSDLSELTDKPTTTEAKPTSKPVPPTELIVTGPEGDPVAEEEEENEGEAMHVEAEGKKEELEAEGEDNEEDEDAEGLSPEQQQAIIDAATSHFVQSSDRTNHAVKQSVALTPRQTRKNLNDSSSANRSASPSRSRSPSPSRPPPPHVTASPAHQRHYEEKADSRGHSPVHEDSDVPQGKYDQNSDTEESSPETKQQQTNQAPAVAEVAIDDLLSFDDDAPVSQPAPAVQPVAAAPKANPIASSKPQSALNDLLSLDPLLDTGSDSIAEPVLPPAPQTEGSGLPAGLKPAPTDVVIRPAVASVKKKENALDDLDTTLASLASSLGASSTNWGNASAPKNK